MPKKREQNIRKINPRILILCQGETEPIYFKSIKNDKKLIATVVIKSIKGISKQIVEEAIKIAQKEEKQKNPFSAIWTVCDHDNHKYHKEAFELAKKNNVEIAFSSICFEIWFLLHFEYTCKAFDSGKSLCNYLEKYIKDYDKTNQSYYEKRLKNNTTNAIQNAEKLRLEQKNNNPDEQIFDLNPYTNVDKLVNYLIGQG